ncbi:cobyrinate a,c-diamide synthase [Roseateles depolymerans]|uniref:Cobyrinic acid a,c-diamide synthase n=1 Tax=Roseateles depolymerans TaxID=76731 RepID=A0A0U3MAA9_9BURK|nr:cobyrinate a,c-diamide synthase [Roseateles depolymerans]ALV05581.1 Cobyrinic acid a,c-diamide synthase [Roseateles depolymerans]REG14398.1 hydrogenobyrinic acid a,c-diamide synthase (glutamine-hydrolysing) /cobyrinate a,c-diamide synthase [Roseateles depolymerans]
MTCPTFLISAPASGQGKTSITAAIARSAVRRGLRVRVFKTGPDYLDPMVLGRACGHPVYQLDLFMGGEAHCRALLDEARRQADLVLVEGVMGLFDGAPSSADLAARFGLPVLVVLDASGMAQTFAAVATGLARFRSDLRVAGVVANRVGSAAHARMVAEGLPPDLPLVAALQRQEALSLPERHLGLVQALELADIDARLDAWADAWEAGEALGQGLESLGALHATPSQARPAAANAVSAPAAPEERPLRGLRIAVAQDACFSFIYPANLDCLRDLGAEVLSFSPLAGDPLPDCDGLWLPGGYPELHAPALKAHPSFFESLRQHLAAGRPLLAECGGMLVLLDHLTDADGVAHPMAALMPGSARMQSRLAALGLQSVDWPEGALRGHSFHYSTMETPLVPVAVAANPNGGRTAEPLYQQGALRASYLHHYFPSNPTAVAAFFRPLAP